MSRIDTSDTTDPFRQIADAEAAHEHALESAEIAADDATKIERARCALVLEEAIEEAASRGLTEQSPVVRILSGLKFKIENG